MPPMRWFDEDALMGMGCPHRVCALTAARAPRLHSPPAAQASAVTVKSKAYLPAWMRYRGNVSGPQLAVPSPRWP